MLMPSISQIGVYLRVITIHKTSRVQKLPIFSMHLLVLALMGLSTQ
ncbi:hypothetical protein FOPG_17375 [Fusarium oxysporum f. sp. conglutinans race 2 54008]|uniref:Uncharacterized protein n=1 Tax=Fusarium oxysporum f. sp. conglutinans race 2 54008 TaxID=1089457 RepID=X0GSW2_FUSOX|nr:hypothetical protein FOPG_17375 [Fusarium oxysporum f. sp. conglutinans race 2 54008]